MNEPLLTWAAAEHVHKEHGADWYWTVGVVSVGIAIIAIIFGNLLLALFVIIGGISLALHSLKKPPLVQFSILERGVQIDTQFYAYSNLESFWILESTLPNKLFIKSKKLFMPLLTIPLEGVPSDTVREILIHALEEEELHEPISEIVMEWIGF